MRRLKYSVVLGVFAVFLPATARAQVSGAYTWTFTTPKATGSPAMLTQSAGYIAPEVTISWTGTAAAPTSMASPTATYVSGGTTYNATINGPASVTPTSSTANSVTFKITYPVWNASAAAGSPPVYGNNPPVNTGSMTFNVNLSGGGTNSVTVNVDKWAS